LKNKGYGKKRIGNVVGRYEGLIEHYQAEGHPNPEAAAYSRAISELDFRASEKVKRAHKSFLVHASVLNGAARAASNKGIANSKLAWDTSSGPGAKILTYMQSLIENDPRVNNISYMSRRDTIKGQLYSVFDDTLTKIGKGAFGRQVGKAHLDNIVRELFGVKTGDKSASDFARAFTESSDLSVDMFNAAGGSMVKSKSYRLPQGQSSAKVLNRWEFWRDTHAEALDWDAMRWPDGSLINEGDRSRILKHVFQTIATGGASNIDPSSLRPALRSMGNRIDAHRFLIYKDAESWLKVHQEFGEGNVFDTLTHHLDDMAHKIAAVKTFGPSPSSAKVNFREIAKKVASDYGGKEVAIVEEGMKNTVEPMLEVVLRENPLAPHSTTGAIVTGAGNIITSAVLGSATLLAVPGDLFNSAAVRKLNGMNPFGGVGYYLKAIATDTKFQQEIAAQSGFVWDETVKAIYGAQRFTALATIGPAVTRRLSDVAIRASLLSAHTRAAQWATKAEFMGLLSRSAGQSYGDLPFQGVMKRYGITSAEWDAFRTSVSPWKPKAGVNFLRPIDVLDTELTNRQLIFEKFQAMILQESKHMIIEASTRGSVALRGSTKPDTIAGAILYSFAMFKSFPMSFQIQNGRLALSQTDTKKRLMFLASLAASTMTAGALGVQMREVAKGRDPLPMDDAAFYTRAMLAGGGLTLLGDLVSASVERPYGQGASDVVGGPLTGMIQQLGSLSKNLYRGATEVDSLSSKEALSSSLDIANRLTPGANVWWARLPWQRYVIDNLQDMLDPTAQRQYDTYLRSLQRETGQGSWWARGDVKPTRLPEFKG
jgi:hypothetical protein